MNIEATILNGSVNARVEYPYIVLEFRDEGYMMNVKISYVRASELCDLLRKSIQIFTEERDKKVGSR